jgi:hypothetical protein
MIFLGNSFVDLWYVGDGAVRQVAHRELRLACRNRSGSFDIHPRRIGARLRIRGQRSEHRRDAKEACPHGAGPCLRSAFATAESFNPKIHRGRLSAVVLNLELDLLTFIERP